MLNGWCSAVLDETLLKLRSQPTIFGYDVLNDENAAASVRAIDARLWKAQRAWHAGERQRRGDSAGLTTHPVNL